MQGLDRSIYSSAPQRCIWPLECGMNCRTELSFIRRRHLPEQAKEAVRPRTKQQLRSPKNSHFSYRRGSLSTVGVVRMLVASDGLPVPHLSSADPLWIVNTPKHTPVDTAMTDTLQLRCPAVEGPLINLRERAFRMEDCSSERERHFPTDPSATGVCNTYKTRTLFSCNDPSHACRCKTVYSS